MANKLTKTGDDIQNDGGLTDISETTGFDKPEYKEARDRVINIIPQVSLWDSIDRYAGQVSMGLFSVAVIDRLRGGKDGFDTLAKVTGAAAMVTAISGVIAHYKKRNIAEPAEIAHREAYITAESEMLGEQIGKAITKNLPQAAAPAGETALPPKDWAKAVKEQATLAEHSAQTQR